MGNFIGDVRSSYSRESIMGMGWVITARWMYDGVMGSIIDFIIVLLLLYYHIPLSIGQPAAEDEMYQHTTNNQYPHPIPIHAPNNMNHTFEDIDKRSVLLEAPNTLLPQTGSKKMTQPPRTHRLQQQQKKGGT